MTLRGTLTLFTLALALVAWFFFFESHQQPPSDGPLFHFDPNKVASITIVDGNESHLLTCQNNHWTISTTPPDHADAQQVASLLAAASEAKPLDILTPKELKNQLSLSSLGLQHPKRSLTIHQEGSSDQTLTIGNEVVSEKRLFAQLHGQKEVLIIPSTLADLAFQSSDDFRDHVLTLLKPSDLKQVTLTRGLGTLQLINEESQWKITQPIEALISSNALAWINPLLQAQVITRVGSDEGDLSAYGLDQPRAQITLVTEDSTSPIILSLGNHVEEKENSENNAPAIYLRSSARHSIFKVPAILEQIFMISPDMLRDHELFKINLDTVDRIEITKSGTTVLLRRQPSPSEDWLIEGKESASLSAAEIQKMMIALQKTKVSAFQIATPTALAAAGLDSSSAPSATIRFIAHLSENTPDEEAGDHTVIEIAFGKPGETTLFARIEAAPELMQIPTSTLDFLEIKKTEVVR